MAGFQQLFEIEEPITIAMIATYPEMTRVLTQLVAGTNIRLMNIHAAFEQAAMEAKNIEKKVDVILTRGGTGHFVKEAVSIPVISIPITPFDLTLSVSRLSAEVMRIGFVNYRRAIFGVDQIEALYQKEIRQYLFCSRAELEQAALQAKQDGCQVFLGGSEGASYARKFGMDGEEIVSGREAIYQALAEAVDMVQIKREERKQYVRLKIAFDSLAEGICITNEHGKVSLFNPSATRIFRLGDENAIGQDIHEISASKLAVQAFDMQRDERNQLEQVWSTTLNSNHIPIYMDQKFIGVVSTFQDITKIQLLEGQIRQKLSQKGLKAKYTFSDILTRSSNMEEAKKLASLYAQTDNTILIEGESGTGKELFAHSIHNDGPRSNGPFVSVNCAAIPEPLLESELFGYVSGAFTGARKEGKQGLFELAHNGSIFLDEIGEMPKYLQARLLRVLQEKEIMRVGDDKIISVNCRIISATNRNLRTLVRKGEFREDLYYRLGILTVKVPPLRERQEDIPLLFEHFMASMGQEIQSVKQRKKAEAYLQRLSGYAWPGNVRELSGVCTRLALLRAVDRDTEVEQFLKTAIYSSSEDPIRVTIETILPLKEAMDEAEQQYISAILERNQNNRSAAAKQLGIGRTTLWRRNSDGEGEKRG